MTSIYKEKEQNHEKPDLDSESYCQEEQRSYTSDNGIEDTSSIVLCAQR